MSDFSSTSGARKPASRRKNSASTPKAEGANSEQTVASDDTARRELIAKAAYYRAERRGFVSGYELEDWLLSESAIDTQSINQTREQRDSKFPGVSSELH